jgi:hypothetical protein
MVAGGGTLVASVATRLSDPSGTSVAFAAQTAFRSNKNALVSPVKVATFPFDTKSLDNVRTPIVSRKFKAELNIAWNSFCLIK